MTASTDGVKQQNDPSPLGPGNVFPVSVQPDFIEVEKNIIALGFFTPSSSRILTDKKKTISTTRNLNGEKLKTVVGILPSAYYGLPVTADQDKYFALQKIIQNHRRQMGTVPDPVGFTSAELLRILGVKKNGKNYEDVAEWMKRMTATTISATVYLAGRRAWVEDTFHVFDRAVVKGMEVAEGKIADMNYVWLAPWQRENIAANYQLPIDFETYCQLRNHIAKALVPLLQIWLYTSIRAGHFEKSYTDLCQLLNIRRYEHLSKIKEVLAPSLDELVRAGYLAAWSIEPRTLGDDFKICVAHGAKFFRDRELRAVIERPDATAGLMAELGRRGVSEGIARQLLASIPDDQPVQDQIEWGDHLIQTSRAGKFRNPAGFYVYLLRNAVLPPREFETGRMRTARLQEPNTGSNNALRRLELENEYAEYRLRSVEAARRDTYPGELLAKKIAELKSEIAAQTPEADNWLPVRLEELALQKLNAEIARELPLLTFEEFSEHQKMQPGLFEGPKM
jgi:Replication initiator protein A